MTRGNTVRNFKSATLADDGPEAINVDLLWREAGRGASAFIRCFGSMRLMR
jgi:hypothetical protein